MHAGAIICLSVKILKTHCCRVQAETALVSFTLLWTVFQTPDVFSIRTLATIGYHIFQLGVSCKYSTQISLLHTAENALTYAELAYWHASKGLSYLLSSKRHSSSRRLLSFHNSYILACTYFSNLNFDSHPNPQHKKKTYNKAKLGYRNLTIHECLLKGSALYRLKTQHYLIL